MASRTATVVGAGMLSAAVLLLIFAGWQFFAVDACLDAGGSFNYAARQCDMARTHPYPGLWQTFGLPLVGAVIAAAIGVGVMVTGGRRAS